ncbi:MAG: prepilin-type N-terminal cleavage/methylation domain-containing protein [Anaerolineae bacterium]|nr:prepilin-type N-terminal cleavage/methylation domain-containing protein [Gloeobacterales cyanobacterium ES-bin-313]
MKSRSVNRKCIAKRDRRGFTLIEVLVTSVIAGVMVLGFLTITTDFFKRDASQRQLIVGQQQLRLASQVIAADIRRAGYIYTDPATANNLIVGAAVKFPTGTTPIFAALIPAQNTNGSPDLNSRFQLVIYGTGAVPTTAPFNSISTLKGNVIYRWYSEPEYFDPRTQRQGQNGDGNIPSALNGGFITYNAQGGASPPMLVGNIATITLTPPTATFGDYASATGENLAIVGYQDSDITKTDQLKGAAKISSFLQARNLGIPPSPLPGYSGSAGGVKGHCSASGTCYNSSGQPE